MKLPKTTLFILSAVFLLLFSCEYKPPLKTSESANFVAASVDPEDLISRPQEIPEQSEDAEYIKTGTVNIQGLRLRNEKNQYSETIRRLNRNETVYIIEIEKEPAAIGSMLAPWYFVKTEADEQGWVYGYYVDTSTFNKISLQSKPANDQAGLSMDGVYRIISPEAKLYNNLNNFSVAGYGTVGDEYIVKGFTSYLLQKGRKLSRMARISSDSIEAWVAADQISPIFLNKNGILWFCREQYDPAGMPYYVLIQNHPRNGIKEYTLAEFDKNLAHSIFYPTEIFDTEYVSDEENIPAIGLNGIEITLTEDFGAIDLPVTYIFDPMDLSILEQNINQDQE